MLRFLCPSLLVAFLLLPALGDEPKGPKVTAEDALKRLKEGNARFVADNLAVRDPYPVQRQRLAKGQHPFAVILSCADSRVPPEVIFNQQLGDVFVVRVAGNVTDAFVLGSIEHAVEHLHAPLVVVLGHTQCGAIKAALEGTVLGGNMDKLVKAVHVGKDLPKEPDPRFAFALRNNVRHHVGEMTHRSKVLQHCVEKHGVRIVGGVYSLETGQVEWLQAEKK